ncbi:uncharacterized protein RJT21DRAFT_28691 [Scheffersomyces amazonensis]|uniref:uncharacterized protein n=1 Tax=Scheffersomyces amazonensis TaxID=1078765 RepID=UPI00315CB785
MSDETIRALKSSNRVLQDKLYRLLREESHTIDGDDTSHDVNVVEQIISNSHSNDNRNINTNMNKNMNGSRHSKYYSNVKHKIDEIRNTRYDLPDVDSGIFESQLKSNNPEKIRNNRQHGKEEPVSSPDESNISFIATKDRPSLLREQSLLNQIESQQKIIDQLQQQLTTFKLEKDDLIEEFQTKLVKENRALERRLRLEFNEKEKNLQHHYNSTMEDKVQEVNSDKENIRNHFVKKIIQLKYDYNQLSLKNASLIDINRYLSQQISSHEPLIQPTYNSVYHEPDYTESNTDHLISKYSNAYEEPENVEDDSTTDHLIGSYHKYSISNVNHETPLKRNRPKSLRSYIFMVLFINRLRNLSEHRKQVKQRLHKLVNSEDINLAY